jgi:cathepsin F
MTRVVLLSLIVFLQLHTTLLALDHATLFNKFQDFMQTFNKTYSTVEEHNYRFQIFSHNYEELEKAKNDTATDVKDGDVDAEDSLELDITAFFDLTDEEFERQYLSTEVPDEEQEMAAQPSENSFITGNETDADHLRHLQSVPSAFDWRSKGVVGPVRQQGSCGGCYAFSAAANLESQHAIKTGRLLSLSEQQIINCNPYAVGCHGGNVGLAFRYLIKTPGLGLSSSLRYIARKEVCTTIAPAVKVKNVLFAGTKNEDYIASFLMKHGPLSIAMNANMFKFYRKGIMQYSAATCSSRQLNHAVNIVGFGVSGGVKYWIVRNSWGPHWGESGYVRVARGTCGVNAYVMTGVI